MKTIAATVIALGLALTAGSAFAMSPASYPIAQNRTAAPMDNDGPLVDNDGSRTVPSTHVYATTPRYHPEYGVNGSVQLFRPDMMGGGMH